MIVSLEAGLHLKTPRVYLERGVLEFGWASGLQLDDDTVGNAHSACLKEQGYILRTPYMPLALSKEVEPAGLLGHAYRGSNTRTLSPHDPYVDIPTHNAYRNPADCLSVVSLKPARTACL